MPNEPIQECEMPISTPQEIIEDIRLGKMVILMDDEDAAQRRGGVSQAIWCDVAC